MSNASAARAGLSANASSEWVVFTGKLPQELKTKLKVASAALGRRQQEIVAEAVEKWLAKQGL
ncbi:MULTISPECIES: hypothetical protein [unclassified Leclercia]|uniref:Ribbon-helix-helix protein CopG domain-containing protein n=1 Tax=Leclercia barmai TaxID=2785629 RepID=A0ABS7RZB0_9ENTR|nr:MULTISPECIES: hypothetical protein [unclassified Leclercia]MBZ0059612.1 hypothetical protein [Leclercia sp. EMC7]MCM5697255.1 hypothetical protein [Leclercia sp. LTM01]MCM5702149.1 hypothetical protein [Leclercia sp. LTM14]